MTKPSRDSRRYAHGAQVGKAFTIRVPEPEVKKEGKRVRVSLNPPGGKMRAFRVVPRDRVDTGGYYAESQRDTVYVDHKLSKRSQVGVAIHEATESMLRDKGLPYDPTLRRAVSAHMEANKAEKRAMGPKQFRRETLQAFRVIDENKKLVKTGKKPRPSKSAKPKKTSWFRRLTGL